MDCREHVLKVSPALIGLALVPMHNDVHHTLRGHIQDEWGLGVLVSALPGADRQLRHI